MKRRIFAILALSALSGCATTVPEKIIPVVVYKRLEMDQKLLEDCPIPVTHIQFDSYKKLPLDTKISMMAEHSSKQTKALDVCAAKVKSAREVINKYNDAIREVNQKNISTLPVTSPETKKEFVESMKGQLQ